MYMSCHNTGYRLDMEFPSFLLFTAYICSVRYVTASSDIQLNVVLSIGPLILMIFFGMLIYGFVYVWFMIPEVKGLSLEEVRILLPNYNGSLTVRARLMNYTEQECNLGSLQTGSQPRSRFHTTKPSIPQKPTKLDDTKY